MEFKKYYLSEFQFHDGEVFITFNIVSIDTNKNEITVAISNRGRISVTTYDLLTDNNGSFYFEYGVDYEKSILTILREVSNMNDFIRHIRKCNLTLADDVIITYDNVKQ